MPQRVDPITDAFATATVLAWRLPMLWAMAFDPTPRRRAEALRMITEKSAAAAEAVVGAQAEMMLSFLKPSRGATSKILDAVLKPSRRRIRANARRLKASRRI